MKLKKGIGILISLIAISILIPTGNILLTPTEASVILKYTKADSNYVNFITIDKTNVEIKQGENIELNANISFGVENNTYVTTVSAVTWSSSDDNNVTVDQNGVVSVASDAALKDYTITATSDFATSEFAKSTITVVAPPSISSNPSGQAVYEGENASFTVGASGTNLTYQWQVDTGSGFTNISDGGVYSGTATSTLDITNATLAMNGYKYQVVVNGKVSPAATSNGAVLTVNPLAAPSISSNPSGQTVYEGENASFTVGASGTELTYKWQVDTGTGFEDIIDGGVYSGTATSTLDITNATLAMNGYKYQVVVNGKVSPAAISNGAALTVNPLAAPSITSNPSDKTVNEGENASFTVGASGTDLTYKWQVDTGTGFADISDGGVYSGATTQTLNITGATLGMNGYKYQVVVSGKVSPAATSNGVVLTVNALAAPPSISSNPIGQAVYEGDNASFTVRASGTDLTYKWQVNSGAGFIDISDGGVYSGATTSTLNITGAALGMSGYKYQVVVNGKASPAATSNGVALIVIKKLEPSSSNSNSNSNSNSSSTSSSSSSSSSSSGSSSSSSSSSTSSSSSSSTSSISNANADATNNSTNASTNTAIGAENLADNTIKSIGAEVKATESIKTQNGGSAVVSSVSLNGKSATVVTTNVSDKVEVKATAGENTVVYAYVKELNAYMPVKSEIAFDKVIFTAAPETAYVVADTNAVTNVVQTGWNKTNDSWYLVKEDGSLATGWYKDSNGSWYNLSPQGKMNTGWIKDTNGAWYYLDPQSGRMKEGWVKDSDGKWYYLNTNGSMAYNTYIDGYRLGSDGAWIE